MNIKRAVASAAIVALAGAVTIGVAACGERPVSGTITHKSYSAPYTYMTYPCVAYGRRTTRIGSTTSTTTYCMMYGVQVNHMPATYQLCVKGVDKNGKDASDCWYTDPGQYDHYIEGQRWP